ncbi:hypothetical protein ACI65C_006891 [Semiaphis heraclei]
MGSKYRGKKKTVAAYRKKKGGNKITLQSKKFAGPDTDYGDLGNELGCEELSLSAEEVKSDIWHKERKFRLTASNFGRVCKLRANTARTNTVKYILYGEVFTPSTSALRYGIQYEPMAKKDFELKLGLEVLPAGLFIDEIINFLACSPDGLIGHNDLLEIKCPYSAKDMTVIEGGPALGQSKFKVGPTPGYVAGPLYKSIQTTTETD